MATAAADDDVLESPKEMCRCLGISRTTLWRLIRAGRFPRPVQISPGRVGFSRNARRQYVAALLEVANAKAS
jgi:predicted DNA-binding transcriptional regulator AlpA